MILDALLQFSAAQSLGVAQAAVPSTNVIDFGLGTSANPQIPGISTTNNRRDMGVGDNPALKLLVQIKAAVTSNGALTLQVALQGAPDDGTGAPGAFTTWWTSPTYALATLAAGARLLDMDFPRPPAGVAMPRFVRLAYIIGGADGTGGTVDSFIVIDRDDQPYAGTANQTQGGYQAGINVQN